MNAKLRLMSYPSGTALHFTVVTSDMRRAEAAMLASLRSAEAVAEGIRPKHKCGNESFSGPFVAIARRMTEAAREFPAAPHNLLSPAAAREWFDREGCPGETLQQFLIDRECLTAFDGGLMRAKKPPPLRVHE